MATAGDLAASLAGRPPERRALYEEKLARWARSMAELDAKRSAPELVAETVERALAARG